MPPKKKEGRPSFWAARAAPLTKRVCELNATAKPAIDRISEIEFACSFEDRIPDRKPTQRQIALRAAAHHAYCSACVAAQLIDAMRKNWNDGDFISFSLAGRLLFEYAAALNYAKSLLEVAVEKNEWEECDDKYRTLLLGTRSPFWLEWLDIEQPRSMSVSKQIDTLISDYPNAKRDYGFLCECCHPNYLHHYYFHKASSAGDIYTSLLTEKQISTALERTISIVERSVEAVASSLLTIAEITEKRSP
jgi:hypothetical protein